MPLAGIELTGVVGDAFYVGLLLVFFALCVALMRACEHIIGTDESAASTGRGQVAAPVPDEVTP